MPGTVPQSRSKLRKIIPSSTAWITSFKRPVLDKEQSNTENNVNKSYQQSKEENELDATESTEYDHHPVLETSNKRESKENRLEEREKIGANKSVSSISTSSAFSKDHGTAYNAKITSVENPIECDKTGKDKSFHKRLSTYSKDNVKTETGDKLKNSLSTAKQEPITHTVVEESLKDKPVLLKHYRELNKTAAGALEPHIDDPNKEYDLGSGLKMKQVQLMKIAAERVKPILTLIDNEVAKTREEDEIKRQQDLEFKVSKHKGKLENELKRHKSRLEKNKDTFDQEIDRKLASIETLKNDSVAKRNEYKETIETEISNAKEEYKQREEKAITQHAFDKKTLEKNHEELLATKVQALEETKFDQEKVLHEIGDLQERKAALACENEVVLHSIEQLGAIVNEKNTKLDDLITNYQVQQDWVKANDAKIDDFNAKVDAIYNSLNVKKFQEKALANKVKELEISLAKYQTKLNELHFDAKQNAERLVDAKQKMKVWQAEKDKLAEEEARKHERERVIATQEFETRRHLEALEKKFGKEVKEGKKEEQ
ncbi:hypothetical protein PVL30_003881 [Lodderomyces elongisporus]|uniref:uncharacterized protein n=1 Tax=Lodderomyces elongisporus TaxID=36914 RepID=UPI00291FC6FB|nr:uncharacterized protein PVL30_003881 [Lodderomyces elongisporus]WLF80107.1 hypothetical protein PVL30_003881 [Lodderomyces elongisporus]